MNPPFDKEEVEKAAAKPENNKSFGKDGIYVELLKYTPEKAHRKISNMLNNMACTEEYPIETKSSLC